MLRGALEGVARSSRSQAWAAERPWSPETHVWAEGGLVVVDLHDLNVKNAKAAARAAGEVAGQLDSGAVAFVTGRGRHSIGPGVLTEAVGAALRKLAKSRGWAVVPGRAGRWVLVVDPSRASGVATGQLGLGVWLLVILMVAAAIWACLGMPGV